MFAWSVLFIVGYYLQIWQSVCQKRLCSSDGVTGDAKVLRLGALLVSYFLLLFIMYMWGEASPCPMMVWGRRNWCNGERTWKHGGGVGRRKNRTIQENKSKTVEFVLLCLFRVLLLHPVRLTKRRGRWFYSLVQMRCFNIAWHMGVSVLLNWTRHFKVVGEAFI